jgi:hypothetical protein
MCTQQRGWPKFQGGKMLSHRTVAFLEESANSSHLVYPEGGLLFRYQFAYKQAHCCLNGDMRDALYKIGLSKYSEVPEQAANDLTRFFSVHLEEIRRMHRKTALSEPPVI